MTKQNPQFHVISGKEVHDIIFSNAAKITDIVKDTYIKHFQGETVNPESSFLRFPHNAQARIISLPAHLGGENPVAGIKWIASYPQNIKHDLQRASAVIILNDNENGYPLACLEAGIISAVRTAASAIIGAYHFKQKKKSIANLGIIGTGIIASYVLELLLQNGWNIGKIHLYDLNQDNSAQFSEHQNHGKIEKVKIANNWQEVVQSSDLIVLTTTAATPYINDKEAFAHNPVVLNLSLRDIDPEIIINSYNVVDDIKHVLKAETSLHLAQKKYGHHDFINTTLPEILANNSEIQTDKPIIFSPFGMGILDIALGQYVYEQAVHNGSANKIEDFFFQINRNLSF